MGSGISLKKGDLIDLMEVLKEKYGDIKLSDLQDKLSRDKEISSLFLYYGLTGKRVKFFSKDDGIIARIKKKSEKIG